MAQELEGNFEFTGSWRGTYIACRHRSCHIPDHSSAYGKRWKADQRICSVTAQAEPNGFSHDTSLPVLCQALGSQSSQSSTARMARQPAKHSKRSKRKSQPSFAAYEPHLCISNFYSDLLYQPWHCAHVPLKASWLAGDAVPRSSELTPTAFREQYEVPNRPVILTDVVILLSCIMFRVNAL